MRLVFACTDVLGNEVSDQVPPREHLGVGPLRLGRGVVDPRVQSLTPDAGHLLVAEVLRIRLELLVQPVERARVLLGRAAHVGNQRVVADSLRRQTLQTGFLVLDDLIEPGNGVLLLAADRPLDLVDEHLRGVDLAQTVAAAISLTECHRDVVGELVRKQSADELLEVVVAEALVKVAVSTLRHGPSPLRSYPIVSSLPSGDLLQSGLFNPPPPTQAWRTCDCRALW